jgi:PAS domain S-box-containing protein
MNDNEIIVKLTDVVTAISQGRVNEIVPSLTSIEFDDTNSDTVRKLYQEIALFSTKESEAMAFILELSRGNLNMASPKRNHLIDSFKELHSNLRHLVWQTQQIAQGDYNQHIDFLGDFSISFNSLVAALKEKKLVEKELQASEERYRTLVENQGEGLGIVNLEERFTFVNPAAENIFGVAPGGLLGRTLHEFISEEELVKVQAQTFKRLSGEKSTYEIAILRPDGEKRYLLVTATPKFDNEGNFISTFGVFRNITARKLAEEALRESEFFFKESQRAAFIGSYKTDFIAGFWESSEVLDKIFGIDKNYNRSIQGWLDIVHPDDMILMDRYLREDVISGRKSFNREYRIIRKSDGEIRWVHGLGEVAFDADGNIISMIGTIQDITERKQIDEDLTKLNQQLKELNATKDKFFSIIAHDLKSPFNSIIGFSNFLSEQIQAKDYEGIEQYADIIKKSSQRAMDLLTNLLEWSRSQTGKMEFNPEYVEIVSIINEVIELLNDSAHQKSITISRELPHNLPAFADMAMVSTIMRNLISNAIKFTHTGGNICINAFSGNKQVEISISDNGVGMSEETRIKLFRMEENISTTGTANEKGSGLGLILCKEFVEQHGGKIWVKSKLGNGSSFHFTLPYSH